MFRCEDDGRGIDVAWRCAKRRIRKGRSPAELDALDAEGLVGALLQGGLSHLGRTQRICRPRYRHGHRARRRWQKLGAEFSVATTPGKGTMFELVVPLSVSSVEALIDRGRAASPPPFRLARRSPHAEARAARRAPQRRPARPLFTTAAWCRWFRLPRLLDRSGPAAPRGQLLRHRRGGPGGVRRRRGRPAARHGEHRVPRAAAARAGTAGGRRRLARRRRQAAAHARSRRPRGRGAWARRRTAASDARRSARRFW